MIATDEKFENQCRSNTSLNRYHVAECSRFAFALSTVFKSKRLIERNRSRSWFEKFKVAQLPNFPS
jgi:hypothetical protein